jgi:hypothetical protein
MLRGYHVGFDQKKFRLRPLVEVIRSVIPEFALGYHESRSISMTEVVDRLRHAAETVFLTDKYQKRGEFGELILHLLLRDFHNTIPLISKIYFKDSHDVTVHGFDGVQITIDGDTKKLWLGESKLYKTGDSGIRELAKDFENHVNEDYLRKEFSLISKRLPSEVPEIDHWRNLMSRQQKLDTIFSSIVIPMVCTYSSGIFDGCEDNSIEYFENFEEECRSLFSKFQDEIGETDIEIILLLLPIPDKEALCEELNKRLKAMQSI